MIKQVFINIIKKAKELCETVDFYQLIGIFIMAIAIIHPVVGK